jgi:hypothetical protein
MQQKALRKRFVAMDEGMERQNTNVVLSFFYTIITIRMSMLILRLVATVACLWGDLLSYDLSPV